MTEPIRAELIGGPRDGDIMTLPELHMHILVDMPEEAYRLYTLTQSEPFIIIKQQGVYSLRMDTTAAQPYEYLWQGIR